MFTTYPKSGRGEGLILPLKMCLPYPILNKAAQRKLAIIKNQKAIFIVRDNPSADASKPFIERCLKTPIRQYNSIIKMESFKQDVDADLIRAIMFMETSHGWYDEYYPWRKSILPMNIHYSYWKDLGFSKEQLLKPNINIHVGTLLLKRIIERIQDPKISKVASVYNVLGREKVNDYGARVAKIYKMKAWDKC